GGPPPAAARAAGVGVVLDRVAPENLSELGTHLGQMMAERGLGESPLFGVPETGVDADGLLPVEAVQPIKSWLATLAYDQASRSQVVHQTLDGAIAKIVGQAPDLVLAADEQVDNLDQLRAEADHSYAEAVRSIGVQTADGTLLRGEVLTRWHEFVGTGEFFRALEQKISWLRDRIAQVVRGEPQGAGNVKVAVEAGLEALVREEAEAAAERAEGAWQAHPAGRAVLANDPANLSRSSPDFAREAARAIRDWQGDVLDLVADEGMGKRSKARFLAFGVNALGVALMIVVFSQTGGLMGAEVGVAGGTALLAQRVLEAVFGDQAIRKLANRAKEDLDARVSRLLSAELRRFHAALDGLGVPEDQAERLQVATERVARAKGLKVHVRRLPRRHGEELLAIEAQPVGEEEGPARNTTRAAAGDRDLESGAERAALSATGSHRPALTNRPTAAAGTGGVADPAADTGPDEAGPDEAGPDEAGPDEAEIVDAEIVPSPRER
ncbi:MAG: ABC transporter, partial [Propionibacteriales bacterium]|nr:ABC transporter [Propionibacteriales bacterium]